MRSEEVVGHFWCKEFRAMSSGLRVSNLGLLFAALGW